MKSQYRTDFPLDSLMEVGDAARKLASGAASEIDKASALRSCWDVQGYAMNMAAPDSSGPVRMGAPVPVSCGPDELNELADKCEHAANTHKSGNRNAAAMFDWKSVLKTLVPLILALLG